MTTPVNVSLFLRNCEAPPEQVHPAESKVQRVFQGANKFTHDPHLVVQGACDYFKGERRSIPSEPLEELLTEIQDYIAVCKPKEKIPYLLFQLASIIFPEDGVLNIKGCHTISSFLQKGLKNQLTRDIENQVCAVIQNVIQNPEHLSCLEKNFEVYPPLEDLINKDEDVKMSRFIDVKRTIILYLFYSSSAKRMDLSILLDILHTGHFIFKDATIPVQQIWETVRKKHYDNSLCLLTTAIFQFIALNTGSAREPWRALSDQLFLIEDDSVEKKVINFQVSFDSHSLIFPFSGNSDDIQPFTKIRRLYFLTNDGLKPIDSLTALQSSLNQFSEEFKQRAVRLMCSQNQLTFSADWYEQYDALILIG